MPSTIEYSLCRRRWTNFGCMARILRPKKLNLHRRGAEARRKRKGVQAVKIELILV
jgi:hypothetical protein